MHIEVCSILDLWHKLGSESVNLGHKLIIIGIIIILMLPLKCMGSVSHSDKHWLCYT